MIINEDDKLTDATKNYVMDYTPFDRDMAITISQYILSPDIPASERKHFEKFQMLFGKMMALGNIERWDMTGILAGYDEVCLLMEMRLYQEARKLMGRILMEMQCSRSFNGFYTLFGQTGILRTESIKKIIDSSNKSSFGKGGFLKRMFGKKEKEESGLHNVGMERNE